MVIVFSIFVSSPSPSNEKLNTGLFDRPQIRQLMRGQKFCDYEWSGVSCMAIFCRGCETIAFLETIELTTTKKL